MKRELSSEGCGGGKGVDRGKAGAKSGGHAGHPSCAGEKKNALSAQFIGEVDA